ncbi:polysaccharide deacetylase [Streptomyces cinnamoneus]|uniref:Polysaccharide deacetylase n=1 Tax=Streptomyces cinnamoneus TaxID=53446 RepID=A0A2G1XIK9_STRCJ|nr:polysaccharide deacetylase family protein [Streptomyces cinnamoneus]PHQ51084.1 polysaccharide deacetylase [Streptomyces cinnamoneus]PPT13693.1 polysaccharide deacetylase [Streptomyces cinnamoneus]
MSPTVFGRRRAALASAALLLAGALAGCSGSSGSSGGPEKPPRPASSKPAPASPSAAAGPDAATYRRWGLDKPLAAPPAPPATKLTDGAKGAQGGGPPVIRRIPTKDKVVFVTIDDGAEKDPEFVKMTKELKLPFTMFLTGDIARAGRGYDYFEQLSAPADGVRNGIANHTVSHPNLRTLPADAQRREICGQQDALEKRFGIRPALFRPPYGNYNDQTLAAAGGCGVRAVVLWEATMQINDMRYAEGDKLRPGDIILAHFRGPQELKGTTMTQMVANMLRSIERQGYTVARLEDYL